MIDGRESPLHGSSSRKWRIPGYDDYALSDLHCTQKNMCVVMGISYLQVLASCARVLNLPTWWSRGLQTCTCFHLLDEWGKNWSTGCWYKMSHGNYRQIDEALIFFPFSALSVLIYQATSDIELPDVLILLSSQPPLHNVWRTSDIQSPRG